MRLMRESLLLIAIGLADLFTTLVLLSNRGAREGNPLMAYYLQFGVGVFVVVKLALLLLPIFVAEWSKRYRPRFVRWMLRGAIAAYVGSYLVLFVVVNLAPVAAEKMTAATPEVRAAQHAR